MENGKSIFLTELLSNIKYSSVISQTSWAFTVFLILLTEKLKAIYFKLTSLQHIYQEIDPPTTLFCAVCVCVCVFVWG